ncbi:thioredoxin family protein [Myxococcota bacterium]|nr:thioredoxin family protein [Myxococcota bacterium]
MLRLALLSLVLGGCFAEPAPQAAQAAQAAQTTTAAAAEHDQTLLFFINPSGRPCQMQDQIIQEMGTSLTSKVNLQYVSVNDPASREIMGRYGVRALPTLILVDGEGAELHRFPAGIRPAETILAAIP